MDIKNPQNNYLDKAIFFCIFLFLASLSVSIFVNQLGYYGALILLLYKYFSEKKNPFSVNGLEIFFLLYIIAEIASTVFSVNKEQSFHNLLKRFLLLPILYTVVASSTDFNKAKFFLKTYLGFALLSVVLYLGFSVRYYLLNLYQLEQSGPGIYQYPITTSELMSFTTVILFSFLIDEKNKFKHRAWIFIGFCLTCAALLATYKRTGWIGAAAGIVMVIILKKKWFLLAPIVLAGILLPFFEKEISQVFIYDTKNEIHEVSQIKSAGRAYDVLLDEKGFWLADYENGIVKYSGNKPVNKISTPSPVSGLSDINDSLVLAELIDTRFVLYKKENNNLLQVNEFASPGFTLASCQNGKGLYILDRDSGLTVYPNFLIDTIAVRASRFSNYQYMFCDTNYLVLYSAKTGLEVYALKNNMPDSIVFNHKFENEISYINYFKNQFLIEDKTSFRVCKIDLNNLVTVAENKEIKGVIQRQSTDSSVYILSNKGVISKFEYPFDKALIVKAQYNTGYLPKSFFFCGDTLYTTKLKNSRIASIVDPYNPSNYTRFALWSAGIKIFKDYPIFGVGDIDLAKLYVQYKHFYDKEIQGHLHNNYIHILVTLGLFGFIVVLLLLIKIFLLNYKIFKTLEKQPFSSSFAAGALGCLVSFFFAGLTEWNFGDHEVITMVWFITGLNIAFYKLYLRAQTKKEVNSEK